MAKTSIIVVAWNELHYTRQCLESIQAFTDQPYELILIDNGSQDGTADFFATVLGAVVIHNEQNLGFAGANNQGIRAATGDYILLLNNDTIVSLNWLANMLRCLQSRPDIGLVAPRSNFAAVTGIDHLRLDGWAAIHQFAYRFNQPDPRKWYEVPEWLPGFCLLAKRPVFETTGILDEKYSYGFLEDVDFCRRARQANWRLFCAGDTFVFHYGSRTFLGNHLNRDKIWEKNFEIFQQKWGSNQ